MKKFLLILGSLGFAASATMWYIGGNNSALTELRDLFWVPLPLGLLFLILGALKKDKPAESTDSSDS
ncbi:hypothetical protein JYT74_00700 [Crocinitomix catalasitica]|nr:hypothetical protein [Crocinitomix catalasitica]